MIEYRSGREGKELIRRTQQAAPQANLLLLAAPAAVDYYRHIGFEQMPQAWILRPGSSVTPDEGTKE